MWKPGEPLFQGNIGPHSLHPLLLAGKPYGADDFLPVLMYVLAHSNLTEMLLNVEYMMELMDPALQLGEGECPPLCPPPSPGRPITCSRARWPGKDFLGRGRHRLSPKDLHTGPDQIIQGPGRRLGCKEKCHHTLIKLGW